MFNIVVAGAHIESVYLPWSPKIILAALPPLWWAPSDKSLGQSCGMSLALGFSRRTQVKISGTGPACFPVSTVDT